MTTTTNLEKGKVYHVDHCRKGQFDIRVSEVSPQWVVGEIVAGRPKFISTQAMLDDAGAIGNRIDIRRSLAKFTEVEDGTPTAAR